MRRRTPRLSLPSDVASELPLRPGERPLAWATDTDDRWYVGTDRAVHLPTEDGYRRLPWEQVERADWERDAERLAIIEVAEWGQPEARTVATIAEQGQLLELLRERVTKSVVVTLYAPVRGKSGLTVVARRSPTGEGPLVWSYLLAKDLDPDDPQVVEVAERTLRQAAHEVTGLS